MTPGNAIDPAAYAATFAIARRDPSRYKVAGERAP